MTESSDDSSNSTPTKRGEIDPRLKLVTGQGGGVLIIGGVRPPRKREQQPDDKREEPENSKTGGS